MSTGRACRRAAALVVAAGALLVAQAVAPGPAEAFGAKTTAAPKPTPTFVLPSPTSTVGGARLAAPGVLVHLRAGIPPPPKVQAAAWLIADLDTGAVLAALNPHVPLAPASTLKILTAVALTPRLDLATVYTATPADAGADGSKVGLVAGSRYSVDDLIHGLLLGSGNDAASALATLSGGMPATAALMNRTAARLQACDTRAVNDSGLDASGQVTSAYDLALFGRAALADPGIATILRTTTYEFPGAQGGPGHHKPYQIQNHNHLLRNYPGATGVKNGFTEAARGSFVGSATRSGHSYIAVVLRAEGSTWHETAAMLDWAFAAGPSATPVGRLTEPLPSGVLATCPPATPTAEPGAATVAAPAAEPSAVSRSASGGPGTGWAAAGVAAGAGIAGVVVAGSRRRRRRP